MTSPVIASRTPTLISSDSGLHTINLGGPSAGDLLVVVLAVDNDVRPFVIDGAFSGKNWQFIAPVTSSGLVTGVVYWKVAEGSDALRIQLGTGAEQSTAECIRITGHGSSVSIASAVGNSTNGDPPNGTISGSAQDVLVIAALCIDAAVVATVAPASYGNLTTQAGGASGASVSIADRALSAVTSENPGAFTTTTEQWVAFTIIIPENAITTNARTTQEAVEAVNLSDPNAVITQAPIEVVSAFALNMVVTQVPIEVVTPQTQNMYVTQAPIEVLSGDPWPTGDANKYRQIQIAC